jgi:protoheme IX farnesyltransferase
MINYYLLMKPGIILGNLITVGAGFFLASQGSFDLLVFLAALFGLGLVMGSACVMNNYIDRHLDQKMERTKYRALVTGLISEKKALLFATVLGFLGGLILILGTNKITFFVALFGYIFYMIYSLGKSHTVYGTAIGSVSGAVPPVVGYCAIRGEFDLGALILFGMMVFWQMPHFFAIAIFRMEDYRKANIPVFPIAYGLEKTRERMGLYIVLYILTSALLTLFGFVGYFTLGTIVLGGLLWLKSCFQGIPDAKWGYKMFKESLVLITIVSFAISFKI